MRTRFQQTLQLGLVLLFAPEWAKAQTQVDLRSQSKSVDFSNAPTTKPVRTGTSLPSSCGVGALFFRTDATPGGNLYGCTSTNTWSSLGAGGGSAPAYVGGATGAMRVNNGVTPREIDIDTVIVPRKRSSETITGLWTFVNGFVFGAGAEPICNNLSRGRVVMVLGGPGVADTLRVCRKNAVDSYEWAALY